MDQKRQIRRICIPARERIKYLACFGYTHGQITDIINTEYADLQPSPISGRTIKGMLVTMTDEIEEQRKELALHCREELKIHLEALFRKTQQAEHVLVDVYERKMREATTSLDALDLEEKDDDDNYVNTGRVFVLLELIDKFHIKMAKLVGTEAMRDIEVFRQKADIQAAAKDKGDGLLPAIDVGSGNTNFLG
jgi:hypothetical protein